jgi:molybdate transport system regulatory protein
MHNEMTPFSILQKSGDRRSKIMAKVKAKFKLWLSSESAEGVFGDGKWRLLEAIDANGSLQAACDSLEISYRKGWGDLKKAQDFFGMPLLNKKRGGINGGQTQLTGEGNRLLKAYAAFRRHIEKAVDDSYVKHIQKILE